MEQPSAPVRAASPARPHSRRNLAGRGGFAGERTERTITRLPRELEDAGAWSQSIVYEFPVSLSDIKELWAQLKEQAAAEGVKLVLRARQSSFGEPKITVRGFQHDVHIDVLRKWTLRQEDLE